MFSPLSDEEGQALGLHRCIRIWPHHGDTGGFFAAVLYKETHEQWAHRRGVTSSNSHNNSSGSDSKNPTAGKAALGALSDKPPVLAKKERRRERSQFKIEDR
jgi:hypothetical protein